MDREKLIDELDSCILMARATETKLVHIYVEQAEEILTLLKEQDEINQCLKKKCVICPHCSNCDVDENGLLKEHEVMSPNEFKNELLKMFSSIWDCEIDHSIFQDTVGELMSAVMQLYTQAVKWE